MRTPQSRTARENPPSQSTLEERMPVQAKLAAAWTSFMFLYIYVDYLHLYKPGAIRDILDGVVFKFDINQAFVVIALTSVAIPILMILLSTTLPARANRATNLVVASLYIPYSAFNLAGGSWIYFYGTARRSRPDCPPARPSFALAPPAGTVTCLSVRC
jgi:hypothetical protein